jgi:hypothetical protein
LLPVRLGCCSFKLQQVLVTCLHCTLLYEGQNAGCTLFLHDRRVSTATQRQQDKMVGKHVKPNGWVSVPHLYCWQSAVHWAYPL